MSRTYTTTGVILKRRDYQENDRLFVIYTKDYGKLEIMAKGTKKIKSKLNSYLEPGYYVKIMVAKGKVFDKLANADLLKSYSNLRQDQTLLGFYLLNYLTEATDFLIGGQIVEKKKFELFLEILDILDLEILKNTPHKKERLLVLANLYLLKLLQLLGYIPQIKRCLICHKGLLLLDRNIFDLSSGGIVCEDCKKVCLIKDYMIVSDSVIKLLQLAQEKELKDLAKIIINAQESANFNKVMARLLLVHIERPLKSLQLIKIIQKN